MAKTAFKYNAFISYSHAVDEKTAPALQSALHRFAKPWNRLRALRVFRDKLSLAANTGLWSAIELALSESEFFILLASPDAARSEWVLKELDYWCRHKPLENLLIVLTDGDITWDQARGDFDWKSTTALPGQLHNVFPEEPRYIDLRWARSVGLLTLDLPDFRDCIADLAAPLHKRSKDEMIGDDVLQYRRSVRIRQAFIASLTVFSIFLAGLAGVAYQQRNQALVSQSRFLADQSQQHLRAGDTVTAMLLALEALPEQSHLLNRPHVPAAEAALYQAVTWHRVLRTLEGHEDAINSIAFSDDGRKFVSASNDQTARVWNAETGETLSVLRGHDAAVIHARYCSPGDRILTVSADQTIGIWAAETGKLVHRLREPEDEPVHHTAEKKDTLFSFLDHAPLYGTRFLLSQIQGEPAGISASEIMFFDVASSQDCKRIMAKSINKAVSWDGAIGKAIATFDGQDDWLVTGRFGRQGSRMVSAGGDGTTRVWDGDTGQVLFNLDESGFKGPTSLQEFIDTKLADQRISEISEGLQDSFKDMDTVINMRGHLTTCAAFSPDGRQLIVGSITGVARIYNAQSGKPTVTLRGQDSPVTSVSFSPDGSRVMATSVEGDPLIWDAKTGELLVAFQPISEEKRSTIGLAGSARRTAIFSPDGEHIMRTFGGTADLWNARNGQRLDVFREQNTAITHAAISPGGKSIVTGAADGKIRLRPHGVGAASLQPLILRGHTGKVNKAAFSRDGHRIITASDDGTARIWDAHKGNTVAVLSLQEKMDGSRGETADSDQAEYRILSAEFSPDDRRILVHSEGDFSGNSAGVQVTLWNADSLTQIIDVVAQNRDFIRRDPIEGVMFDRNGRRVVLRGGYYFGDEVELYFFDAATGAYHDKFYTIGSNVKAVSRYGDFVTACCQMREPNSGAVHLYETDTHDMTPIGDIHLPKTPDDRLYEEKLYIAVGPDGDSVMVGTYDGVVHMFTGCQSFGGCERRQLRGHTAGIDMAVFGRKDRLVTVSKDGTSRLWNTKTGQELARTGSSDNVTFSPDGKLVVLGILTSFSLYNAQTGDWITSLPIGFLSLSDRSSSPAQHRTTISFSPTGRQLVNWVENVAVVTLVFDSTEALTTFARKLVSGQGLTDDQKKQFFLE